MIDITVIICTHNPRPDYLHIVLDALRKQTLPQQRWELLLVDNASDRSLASKWDLSWHQFARHIREAELGVAAARRRGIREASADLLIFVDDDNVLAQDYLSVALGIAKGYLTLGVWGSGAINPKFEDTPAESLKSYLHYLSLRSIASHQLSNDFTSKEAMPWGAGMCLRKNIADAYCRVSERSGIQIASRRDHTLLGGEDVEMCIVGCKLGFCFGVFPQLKLTHIIPKHRVTEEYLLRLREAHVITDVMLAYKWQGRLPRRPLSLRTVLGLLKNILTRRGIHRKMYFAYWRGTMKGRRMIAGIKQS
jgi:glycosyltransferase involved in cell wall biosynthesis